ncbi:MAG: phosphoribosylanthranilate isomerase [Peptococcaceae bacterium]|jgi:phosphoribosylanthranilate isomerase|nr:phosphoribosylanthranilate isomerase [Peptococcaceae bacterium]
MSKLKICGLFRECDIEWVNEAAPEYIGFVFAHSKRQVSLPLAERLRTRLNTGITPVGVFVNAPLPHIAALYRAGIIEIAQLHGGESDAYADQLKQLCAIPIIRVLRISHTLPSSRPDPADYLLYDNAHGGSGQSFDWDLLTHPLPSGSMPPWFLAGGIGLDNIQQALSLHPYAIDISSGAETEGVKDRRKILALTRAVRSG